MDGHRSPQEPSSSGNHDKGKRRATDFGVIGGERAAMRSQSHTHRNSEDSSGGVPLNAISGALTRPGRSAEPRRLPTDPFLFGARPAGPADADGNHRVYELSSPSGLRGLGDFSRRVTSQPSSAQHSRSNSRQASVSHSRNVSSGTVHTVSSTLSEHKDFYPAELQSPRTRIAASQSAQRSRASTSSSRVSPSTTASSGPSQQQSATTASTSATAAGQGPSIGSVPNAGPVQMAAAPQMSQAGGQQAAPTMISVPENPSAVDIANAIQSMGGHMQGQVNSLSNLALLTQQNVTAQHHAIHGINQQVQGNGHQIQALNQTVAALHQRIAAMEAQVAADQKHLNQHQRQIDETAMTMSNLAITMESTLDQHRDVINQHGDAINNTNVVVHRFTSASNTPVTAQQSTFGNGHFAGSDGRRATQRGFTDNAAHHAAGGGINRQAPPFVPSRANVTPGGNRAHPAGHNGMPVEGPNAADDVFGPAVGSAGKPTPARFDQKDYHALAHALSVRVETFVRQYCIVPVSSRSADPKVQKIFELAVSHVDHKGQGVQLLENPQMRYAIVTGIVNRWLAERVWRHNLLSHHPNKPMVGTYLAAWEAEERAKADIMLVNNAATREQLAHNRVRLANNVMTLPGFWRWTQELSGNLSEALLNEILPLIPPPHLQRARGDLFKIMNEAIKIAMRMRQEPRVYEVSFYRYGVRWDYAGMVQRNPELQGQACDESPPLWVIRVTMVPYIGEKSFDEGKYSLRTVQKGEVILCERSKHLR